VLLLLLLLVVVVVHLCRSGERPALAWRADVARCDTPLLLLLLLCLLLLMVVQVASSSGSAQCIHGTWSFTRPYTNWRYTEARGERL
jgi:hypothetical protein